VEKSKNNQKYQQNENNNPNCKKEYTKKKKKGTHFELTPYEKWWHDGSWKWGRKCRRGSPEQWP